MRFTSQGVEFADGCLTPDYPAAGPGGLLDLIEMGIPTAPGPQCWKCGAQTVEAAIGFHLGLPHASWWATSFDPFDSIVSEAFRAVLSEKFHVKRKFSRAMGREYLANSCPKCGVVLGDNFVFGNLSGRGGPFSNPALAFTPIVLYKIELSQSIVRDPRRYLQPGFCVPIDSRRIQTTFPVSDEFNFWFG